jgi:NADH-quinone oxidoreductase subunit F
MTTVRVGTATCGLAAGAANIIEKIQGLEGDLDVTVLETGCIGLCHAEPLVEVDGPDGPVVLYGWMTPELTLKAISDPDAPELESVTLRKGEQRDKYGVLAVQNRVVLSRCGAVDPGSIDDYLETGGYRALANCLKDMTPAQVVAEVTRSGLRGRGGGGFPTGRKWEFTAAQDSPVKFVICNADEGDPGAFMDRSVLEGDPFAVLEGMTLCGYAIGADKGIIYCRAEYPRALQRIRAAIDLARQRGYLGDAILDSSFGFDVSIKEGAGAFVCGEETALIASIEGRRGMPRFRPPYPAVSGLYRRPTNINNVETLACVPWILDHGAAAFSDFGTEKSKGTKVFALAGKVVRGGLVEVPMGTTIEQLVFDVGGGVGEGRTFKAVQIGGPSGGCIPASMADLPVDYEHVAQTGAIMGSGGLVVMDDTTCMVDVARYFLAFTQAESCGKCTFCRLGTKRMLEILERITAGRGEEEDVDRLLELAAKIKESSLCGLGQAAPNPVLTTIQHFRSEYEAHIRDKSCPAHSCSALVRYSIDDQLCTGCGVCIRQCPADAIQGERKEVHVIDDDKCIRCARCITACNFEAVTKI